MGNANGGVGLVLGWVVHISFMKKVGFQQSWRREGVSCMGGDFQAAGAESSGRKVMPVFKEQHGGQSGLSSVGREYRR